MRSQGSAVPWILAVCATVLVVVVVIFGRAILSGDLSGDLTCAERGGIEELRDGVTTIGGGTVKTQHVFCTFPG